MTVSRDVALAELTDRLHDALGVTALPPNAVTRAAVDPVYLHALIGQREMADRVAQLLRQGSGHLPKRAPPPTAELIVRASAALARWAASGFGLTDDATYQRRKDACLACPYLTSPRESLLLRLAGGATASICGLCSCAVDKKARLPTETCPAADPADPLKTRWGDPTI